MVLGLVLSRCQKTPEQYLKHWYEAHEDTLEAMQEQVLVSIRSMRPDIVCAFQCVDCSYIHADGHKGRDVPHLERTRGAIHPCSYQDDRPIYIHQLVKMWLLTRRASESLQCLL